MDLLLSLLTRSWPPERVLLGMQVCKLLHKELPISARKVMLMVTQADGFHVHHISSRLAAFADSLCVLRCRGSSRSCATLRAAIPDAVLAGFGANVAHIDLAGNFIGPGADSAAIAGLVFHCKVLEFLDLSKNPLEAKGARRLASALRNSTHLSHLDLSNTSLGPEGARVLGSGLICCTALRRLGLSANGIDQHGCLGLADALRQCTQLEQLDLHTNALGGEGAGLVAEALGASTNLARLDLGSNQLQAVGASRLAAVLRLPQLEALKLSANSLGPLGARALRSGLGACTSLTRLDLGRNQLGMDTADDQEDAPQLLRALTGCRLAHLDLGGNWLGEHGGRAAARALAGGPRPWLRFLDCSGNNMGPRGTSAVAEAVAGCTQLRGIALGGNKVGDEGMGALARALGSLQGLERLELSDNQLGHVGAALLASEVRALAGMCELDLSHNPLGGGRGEGGAALGGVVRHCSRTLRVLNLTRAGLRLPSVERLAPALRTCEALSHLLMGMNRVGSKGAAALGFAVKEISALRVLDLSQNFVQDEGFMHLAEELSECSQLVRLDVAHNDAGLAAVRGLARALPKCVVVVE